MSPLITKVFAKGKNIYLKDRHLSQKEHLTKPFLSLKGCPRKTDIYDTRIEI
jgi:hypothetical protein